MSALKDRVIIVTGAGRGLGRAYALDLAARGGRVVVNTRPRPADAPGPAEAVVAGIEAAGGTPVEFNTIVVTDGISMGTEGMRA
ncbi:MAG: SDR family NAD(P)-dependent oxidoreductase, partial [Brevundimonas sp.]